MKKILTTLTSVALLAAIATGESMPPVSVTGNAAIGREGNNWTVTTTSKRTVINWNSFDVAEGGSVYFQQPSARSSVLNRVTGASISHIDGLLSSNGRVYLLNPNGIVVGPNGVIRVAEFVGSTLGLSDTAFLAGKDMHFTGTSGAAIVNYGKIDAIGGDVYLIAANVANKGSISAPSGSANLVAANDVLLTQDHQIFVRPGTGTGVGTGVENSGSIDAAIARLLADGNMYALAINNSGVVRANGIAAADGRVMLVAQGGSIVNTGTISARNDQAGGEVRVIGENLTLRGEINAAGANGGGLIETSAPSMDLAGLKFSAGPGGVWLIDPPLVIDAALAGTIAGQLSANTNVAYTGQSSITVASDIIAAPSSTSTYLWLGSTSNIAINASINVGIGRLYLQASDGVAQAAGTTLTAGRLWLNGGGVFNLSQPGNDFGLVAVNVNTSTTSVVTIQDANDITIGTIKGTSGASVLGGELHLLAPNGYVLANGLFGAGIVKEYHALGNVAITETSPLSGAYEVRISNAGPYSKTPAEVAAFTNTTVGALAGIGGNNVNGSAVRIVFDPTLAGDLLGYSWNFRTAETFGSESANDYSFRVINPIGAGPDTQVLADVAQAASRGSAVQDTNEFSWETRWGDRTHTLNGVNPYELSFGSMNVDHPEVLSKLYLRNIFFQGHLIPPPPPQTEALIFDRIIDHVEDFPHLRPYVRVSRVGPELLAPVLDELSTYFDVAAQKTDHRYYYQSVGSIYQIPR